MTPRQVADQLRALGVETGDVLLVHTRFSAVGPIEGGPSGLLAALRTAIGDGGTLVMPTLSAGDAPFCLYTTPTLEMGVVAETFRKQAGVRAPRTDPTPGAPRLCPDRAASSVDPSNPHRWLRPPTPPA